jgi:hypothetical protein
MHAQFSLFLSRVGIDHTQAHEHINKHEEHVMLLKNYNNYQVRNKLVVDSISHIIIANNEKIINYN